MRFEQRTLLMFMLAASLLAACSPSTPTEPFPSSPPIARELREFWLAHGGLAAFGPPLESARQDGNLVRQVFLNVEMIYDPASGATSLAPLGWRLGLAEPPVPRPSNGGLYFDSTGHSLYPGFAQTYARLGGEPVVGPPISEVEFRAGRVFQFFGNLGLYREESAPPAEVRLVALGFAAHAQREELQVRDFRIVVPPEVRSRPFGGFLDRFGGESLFGPPLSEPYLAQDGSVEQVYERAVLYWQPEFGDEVRLRPLGLSLGPAEAAVPAAGDPDGLYFQETGHNVRWALASFYRSFEGEHLLGFPLEEARLASESLRQRFENAILVYRYDLPAHLAVQLAPLGRDYLNRQPVAEPSPTTQPPTPASPPPVPGQPLGAALQTWVEHPVLPSGRSQVVYLRVVRPDGTPWSGAMAILIIQGPRSVFSPSVPSADANGLASVVIDMPDLRPGEIVNYEVAVASDEGIGYALGQFVGGPAMP